MEQFNLINKFINDPNDFDIDYYYWDFLKELKDLLFLYEKEKKKTKRLKEDKKILYGVIDEIKEDYIKLKKKIFNLCYGNGIYNNYESLVALRKLLEEIDNE